MSTASDLRLTNADLECMPDDGNRYELIDGELYISAPPTFVHQTTLVNIAFAFSIYCASIRLVGSFRAPEIVIEILSPGASNERRDRHVKRSLYAARGAGEYWIVDPENRSVKVHRRNEAVDLVFDKSLRQADELTCGFLPRFSVRVAALFI